VPYQPIATTIPKDAHILADNAGKKKRSGDAPINFSKHNYASGAIMLSSIISIDKG
jgi:hypothetical protein